MHTCSHGSQSKCNSKRKGMPQLVASLLHDDYPCQMETPPPKSIKELVWTKLGVNISYSTALRGKNEAVSILRETPEESYETLYCYLYMLERMNHQTITSVKLDESDRFKYLFIVLGASIVSFKVMRKVVTVDATFLKNGYGGVLIFATAHDPNRHHYPLALDVLDGENKDSWTWFFEMFKTVVPDSSELVFMSDRNGSLVNAIANVFPMAHHAYCIWHLAQNVKGRARNVNKEIVEVKFMEIAQIYTVPEFDAAYSAFKTRYLELEDLISKYYWTKLWALAYYRSIYVVPDRSQWDVPDYIKERKIMAPKWVEKRGRKKVKRFLSAGERRPRTQNKMRPRQSLQWLLFGDRNV